MKPVSMRMKAFCSTLPIGALKMKSHLRQPKLKALGPQPQLLLEKESEKATKDCGSSLQPMKRANGAFKLKVQLRQPNVKISDMSVATRIILPYQTRAATDYAIKMSHKLQSKRKGSRGKADLSFDATFEVKRSITQ